MSKFHFSLTSVLKQGSSKAPLDRPPLLQDLTFSSVLKGMGLVTRT